MFIQEVGLGFESLEKLLLKTQSAYGEEDKLGEGELPETRSFHIPPRPLST